MSLGEVYHWTADGGLSGDRPRLERLLIRYKDLSSLLHPKGPLQEFSKTVQVK